MSKRILIAIVIITLLVFTACDALPTQTVVNNISDSEMSTLVALATEVAAPPVVLLPTETQKPEVVIPPTRTASPGTITLTSIVETAPGKAIVSWDAVGNYPAGYKVVWTDVQGLPTFPENTNVYTSDPNARSAMISGSIGKIYYVRVCRFTGDSCDIYSNLGIFAYKMNALTPLPTITSKPADATATKIAQLTTPKPTSGSWQPGTPGVWIQILEMKGGEDGKAYIKWDTGYNPSAGFKIVYSKTTQTPTYGVDPYFYVPGGSTRYGWVDGVQGTTYYYRICGWNGTKCDTYSKVFTYKFPGTPPEPTAVIPATPDPATLTISSISDLTPGSVTVNWTGTGSFPNGYKVVFSKTNPLPTMADGYVYVSDPAILTATVPNLQPGVQYYFRVCKYYGGNCVVYSPVVTFTPAAAAVESGFTLSQVSNVFGGVEISWVIASDNANGYKVLMSTSNPVPDTSYLYLVSSPTTHNYIDTASGPGTVYYKVCRWSGSWCLSFSNTLQVDIIP